MTGDTFMEKTRKSPGARRSRRDFARLLGLGLAASTIVASPFSRSGAEEPQMDVLVKLSTENSPLRLSDTELADLKKDIEEARKGLAKIRDFKVPVSVEPALVFRPK